MQVKKKKMLSLSKLPSAGLGNKLFSWASGAVFAHLNNCDHYIIGMTKIHLGPIFRKERRKRFYFGYFKNEVVLLPILNYFQSSYNKKQIECGDFVSCNGNFIFSEIPHWSDSFAKLRDFRDLIIASFWSNLTQQITSRISKHEVPFIGIHIRMGDFRVLKSTEDFSKVGAVRTPLSYFVEVTNCLLQVIGTNAPITIFSDGYDHELEEVLRLPNAKRAKEDLDIVHLAVLSKSKLIIMSAGSTFSYWAGFLSEGLLINHFQHQHSPIRNLELNALKYEGGFDPEKGISHYPSLLKNLLELKSTIVEN